MTEAQKKLMRIAGIDTLRSEAITTEELADAVMEIAQNQSDLEDAIVELAEMIGGE